MISEKINNILTKIFKVVILRPYPRPSTRKAKEIFGDKSITAVEIGTYEGKNAQNILQTLNVKKFFIIDPYKVYNDIYGFDNKNTEDLKKHLDKVYRTARKRLKHSNTIFLRKTSDEAVSNIPNEVDFIYIDGNHYYEFVKRDMENYYKKIRKGGILAGHDISYPPVMKAVSKFCIKNSLNCKVMRDDWIIIKK